MSICCDKGAPAPRPSQVCSNALGSEIVEAAQDGRLDKDARHKLADGRNLVEPVAANLLCGRRHHVRRKVLWQRHGHVGALVVDGGLEQEAVKHKFACVRRRAKGKGRDETRRVEARRWVLRGVGLCDGRAGGAHTKGVEDVRHEDEFARVKGKDARVGEHLGALKAREGGGRGRYEMGAQTAREDGEGGSMAMGLMVTGLPG